MTCRIAVRVAPLTADGNTCTRGTALPLTPTTPDLWGLS